MQPFGHCTIFKTMMSAKCTVLLVRHVLEYNTYCRMFILIDANVLCDISYSCFARKVYFKKIAGCLTVHLPHEII